MPPSPRKKKARLAAPAASDGALSLSETHYVAEAASAEAVASAPLAPTADAAASSGDAMAVDDASTAVDFDAALAALDDAVLDVRAPRTRRSYDNTMNLLARWMDTTFATAAAKGECKWSFEELASLRARQPNERTVKYDWNYPIPVEPILWFFGAQVKIAREMTKRGERPDRKYKSLYQFISAIKAAHQERSLEFLQSDDEKKKWSKLEHSMKGYQRREAELKINGILEAREGKMQLSFAQYEQLALWMLNQDNGDWATFVWPYFVVDWNLLCRGNTTATIQCEHLSVTNDCVAVAIPKSKNDQIGAFNNQLHVYANPLKPQVCALLALAVRLFCCERPNVGAVFTAADSNAEATLALFAERLRVAIDASFPDVKHLLGVHSERKGSMSYCLQFMEGPNALSVVLRAAYTSVLGDTLSRYLFATNGSDQFCGRVAAGLPFPSPAFQVLPPRFVVETITDTGAAASSAAAFARDASDVLTAAEWAVVLQGYGDMPAAFKKYVVPLLLAVLVHHKEFLARQRCWRVLKRAAVWSIAKTRALGTCIVADSVEELAAGRVTTECARSGMRTTGAPMRIQESAELRAMITDVRGKLDQLTDDASDRDERMHNALLRALERVPTVQTHAAGGEPVMAALDAMAQRFGEMLAAQAALLHRDMQNTVHAAVVQALGARPADTATTLATSPYPEPPASVPPASTPAPQTATVPYASPPTASLIAPLMLRVVPAELPNDASPRAYFILHFWGNIREPALTRHCDYGAEDFVRAHRTRLCKWRFVLKRMEQILYEKYSAQLQARGESAPARHAWSAAQMAPDEALALFDREVWPTFEATYRTGVHIASNAKAVAPPSMTTLYNNMKAKENTNLNTNS